MSGIIQRVLLLADKTTDLVLTCMILVLVLLVSAVLVRVADRWRRQEDAPSCTPHDQLAELRRWRDEGLIEPDEYSRLREKLEAQLRATMGLSTSRDIAPDQLGQFLVPEEPPKTGDSSKSGGDQPPVA